MISYYALFIIFLIPLILHSVGLYLLLSKRPRNIGCQYIYLVNLSISEILISVNASIRFYLMTKYSSDHFAYQFTTYFLYISLIPYYSVMILLTIDRMLQVYLNIRYHLYWSEMYTKFTMLAIWFVSVALLIIAASYTGIVKGDTFNIVRELCHAYVLPAFDFAFILIAVSTYVYILYTVKKKKRKIAPASSEPTNRPSFAITEDLAVRQQEQTRIMRARKKEKRKSLLLYLLILTFVLFGLIPDLLTFAEVKSLMKPSDRLMFTTWTLYAIGFISDAIIYVILSTNVGKKLFKRL